MSYESVVRESKEVSLDVKLWTVNGFHTCLSWMGGKGHSRECCSFLGTRNMGCQHVCMILGEDLYEYTEGPAKGFIEPSPKCMLRNKK